MDITIKYFGAVAEQAGTSTEFLTLSQAEIELDDFKALCFKKYNITNMGSVKTAINRELKETGYIKSGDEVAFLPPFAGG